MSDQTPSIQVPIQLVSQESISALSNVEAADVLVDRFFRGSAILYNAGDGCNMPLQLPENPDGSLNDGVFYIPVIDAGSSACNFTQRIKVLYDVPVVVPLALFFNFTTTSETLSPDFDYYSIPDARAQTLLSEISTAALTGVTPSHVRADFTNVYPPLLASGNNGLLQFIVIVTAILLGIALVASLGMHIHLWRRRVNQSESDVERNEMTSFKGLTREVINLYPVTVYHRDPKTPEPDSDKQLDEKSSDAESIILDSTLRDAKDGSTVSGAIEQASPTADSVPRIRITIQAPDDPEARSIHLAESPDTCGTESLGHGTPLTQQSTQYSDDDQDADTCTICLEDFVEGEDRVRTLSCHHFFHVPCIDIWLGCKSSACPNCKADMSLDDDDGAEEVESPIES